ncbi:MAG: DegT/DnrJ/EryC1/StrS family aminotransferase [Acidimicrobiales bacterium]
MQIFGSTRGSGTRFFSSIDDEIEHDNLFIFDEVGWNFEPSELSAAFGLVQLVKLGENLRTRKRNFARLHDYFGARPDVFVLPRTTPELDTAEDDNPGLLLRRYCVPQGRRDRCRRPAVTCDGYILDIGCRTLIRG